MLHDLLFVTAVIFSCFTVYFLIRGQATRYEEKEIMLLEKEGIQVIKRTKFVFEKRVSSKYIIKNYRSKVFGYSDLDDMTSDISSDN